MKLKRNHYQMNHNWITSFRTGQLVPTFLQQVTPNDIWHGNSTGIFRMEPLEAPAFMQYNIYSHLFFVPYSQIMEEFEDWIVDPDYSLTDTIDLTLGIGVNHPILEAFGNPTNATASVDVNLLPVRAYNHIWNTYFRNEHETEVSLDYVTDLHGVSHPGTGYFGSMTDEAQMGSEETVSSVSNFGVLALRGAMRQQSERERRSMYGEDYQSYLEADFGITNNNATLDRPTHVARSKTTMGISEVVATAEGTSSDIGQFKGHGISGMNMRVKPRKFNDYGLLVGVTYARPRFQIKYGIDRNLMKTYQNKDFLYNPMMRNDNLIVVNNAEIRNDSSPTGIYAYQFRYEHLRSPRDIIAGDMLDTANEAWTAHKTVAGLPTLETLKKVESPVQIFQDQTASRTELRCYFNHNVGKHSLVAQRPTRRTFNS